MGNLRGSVRHRSNWPHSRAPCILWNSTSNPHRQGVVVALPARTSSLHVWVCCAVGAAPPHWAQVVFVDADDARVEYIRVDVVGTHTRLLGPWGGYTGCPPWQAPCHGLPRTCQLLRSGWAARFASA